MRRPFILLGLLLTLLMTTTKANRADEATSIPVHAATFNSDKDEDEPHVADGGLTLYYTEATTQEIRFSRRKSVSATWPEKTSPIGEYVRNKGETRSVYATAGSYPQFLYFAARDREGKNFDLFVAVKQGSGRDYSAPTPVMRVNTAQDECHPWLSADGRVLYFSRKTKEGWRQFASTRTNATGPQGWREPIDLGFDDGFHHATVTADGRTMILQGPIAKDKIGLFRSTKSGKTWSKPQPLSTLNAGVKKGDLSPNFSREGTYLYFASDRSGGKGGLDIYWVRLSDLKK